MKNLLLIAITILAAGCDGKDKSTTETNPVEETELSSGYATLYGAVKLKVGKNDSHSIKISQHPLISFNGLYEIQDGLINSSPWYKNENDRFLFHYDQAEGGEKGWSLDHRKPDGTKDIFSGGWTDFNNLQNPDIGLNDWYSIGAALYQVVPQGNINDVKLFIEEGAQINHLPPFGINVSVLDIAIAMNYTEIAELLKKNGAKTYEEITAAEPKSEEAKVNVPTDSLADILVGKVITLEGQGGQQQMMLKENGVMLAGQDFLMDGGLTYKIKNNEVLFFKDKKRLGEISFFSSSPKVGDQVKGGPKEEKMILKITKIEEADETLNDPVATEGVSTSWHKNGQKKAEGNIKDSKMDGLWVFWHENGQKWYEATYKDNNEISKKYWNGLETYFFRHGQKSSESTYKDGELNGPKTKWDDGGQKISEEIYRDGKLNGLKRIWNGYGGNGELESEENYRDGKKNGLTTKYYKNDQKSSEEMFKDGIPNGPLNRWHENGKKMLEATVKGDEISSAKWWNSKGEEVKTEEEASVFYADELSSTSLSNSDVEVILKDAVEADKVGLRVNRSGGVINHLFYQRGESKPFSGWIKQMYNPKQVRVLQSFKDGKRDGLEIEWYENGQKRSEESWKDGERDGPRASWYENGQKSRAGTTKNSRGVGTSTSWHENGRKSFEATSDKYGKRVGVQTMWYENGQKSSEATFKQDKQEGLAMKWHENGQKSREETYKDGKRDGLRTRWHENGQKDSEAIYRNGRKIGLETTWHENGQKKSEITWKAIEKDTISLEVSVKYWNSEGEPVDSRKEAEAK